MKNPTYLNIVVSDRFYQNIAEFRELWKDKEVIEVAIEYNGDVKLMTMRDFLRMCGFKESGIPPVV